MPESRRSAGDRCTSVYKYFDAHGVLIYVGITGRGMTRNTEHDRSKSWWPFVARQEIEQLPSRDAAAIRERELIERHTPPFNVQHNPDHKVMRDAYLAVVAAASSTNDCTALFKSLGGVLLLSVVKDVRSAEGVRVVSFRTQLAHAPLIAHLRQESGVKVSDLKGVRFGRVVEVVSRGPFAVITAHVRAGVPVDRCEAVLKCLTLKGPDAFVIRRLRVEADLATLAA